MALRVRAMTPEETVTIERPSRSRTEPVQQVGRTRTTQLAKGIISKLYTEVPE